MRRTHLLCLGMLRFDTSPYSGILGLVVAVDSDLSARRTGHDRIGQVRVGEEISIDLIILQFRSLSHGVVGVYRSS